MAGVSLMISARHSFNNRDDLAQSLADRVARGLSRAISRQGSAVLAVSGGTTPALFFEHLSQEDISWEKVTVTLVDERQVDESSPRSNAKLVKDHLLQNRASLARFVPLFQNQLEAEKLSLDVVVLGMGEDGHTASFFPGGDKLPEALNIKTVKTIIDMQAPAAGEPRLTYTLPALLKAKVLCLQVEGQKKRTILETAIAGTDVMTMPIRAVLQADQDLEIFWCP
jgi:6-phosphogluconolactonase